MNILFIADIVPYPPNTGIKIRTFNIIKQLSKRNRIYLIAFNHKKMFIDKKELDIACKKLKQYCEEVYALDIPSDKNKLSYYLCLIRNLFTLKPYRVQRYWSNKCISIIQEIKKSNIIDLVHLDKTELYEYMRFLREIPCVATNHNVESNLMRLRSKYEVSYHRRIFAFLQHLKTKKYEKRVLNLVKGYIACSKEDINFFRNKLNIKTDYRIIQNGVDVSYYQPRKKNVAGSYHLLIGAQSKEATANYDATIYFIKNIWPQIRQKLPNCRLKIVGRNPDQEILKYNKTKSGIEIVGFVKDEREVIHNALSLLVPLRMGGGSRLKIITAMAMEKTIISTSIGAEGILYTNKKDIFIVDSPIDFANLVITVTTDQELRKEIGKEARKLVCGLYDWDTIGNEINKYYDEVALANG